MSGKINVKLQYFIPQMLQAMNFSVIKLAGGFVLNLMIVV